MNKTGQHTDAKAQQRGEVAERRLAVCEDSKASSHSTDLDANVEYECMAQTVDHPRFDELLKAINWSVVKYIIWTYLRGHEDVENILQEVKMILYKSWLKGNIPDVPAAYIFMRKTARCRAINLIRYKSRPEVQRKFERFKALYSDEPEVKNTDDEADAWMWVPWTPWIRSEFGVRMMQEEDYGLQERGFVLPQQWAAETASLPVMNSNDEDPLFPILQSVISNLCVAERRFAPRSGSIFSPQDFLTIQCRDLPVLDTHFSLVLDTEGGKRTLISGTDPAWQERCAFEPEKNRKVRRIRMKKRASEWLEILGCAVPMSDIAVEVRFTFVAGNNLKWESGATFRIAGQPWFDKAEQEIEQKLQLWQADQEGVYSSMTDRFRRALDAAQWGENIAAHLVMRLTALTREPLLTPIPRTLLYYCMGMDHQGVKFASKTLSECHSAGNLLRILDLLCAERGGLSIL